MTHHSVHFILLNDGSFTFGSMPQGPSTPREHCKSCLTHTLACVCHIAIIFVSLSHPSSDHELLEKKGQSWVPSQDLAQGKY